MASDAWNEDIPIWIDGAQKWMTGLTRRTTCDDVIYALLHARGLLETDSTDNYAVFERWRAVERPLQGRTKIVKVSRHFFFILTLENFQTMLSKEKFI